MTTTLLFANSLTITPDKITVTLTGSDRAEGHGLAATGPAPFCALARMLVAAGIDPDLPIEAYRDGVLALRCRSLAAAARLTVRTNKYGAPRFVPWREKGVVAAPPIAQNEPILPGRPPEPKNALAGQNAPLPQLNRALAPIGLRIKGSRSLGYRVQRL